MKLDDGAVAEGCQGAAWARARCGRCSS